MTFSSTQSARPIRNRNLASERINVARNDGSDSPPPLSQSPSTCTSSCYSPPGSPIPTCSSKVPIAVQTTEIFPSRQFPTHLLTTQTLSRQSPTYFHRNRPPIVSPVMPHSPSKSWDEGDDRPTKLRARINLSSQPASSRVPQHQPIPFTQVRSDLTEGSSLRPRYNLNPRMRISGVQLCSDPNFADEAIHDESDLPSLGSQNDPESALDVSRGTARVSINSNDQRPPTPSNTAGTGCTASTLPTTTEDDVSSLGGVEDCSTSTSCPSLMKIVLAIKNNANRPNNLTLEEKALWDVVQDAKQQARMDGVDSCNSRNGLRECHSPNHAHQNSGRSADVGPTSPSYKHDDPIPVSSEFWLESHCQDAQELARKQQQENSRSLQAIQLVLADVQAERDKAVEQLLDLRQNTTGQLDMITSNDIDSDAENQQHEENILLKQELKLALARIEQLEKEPQKGLNSSTESLRHSSGDDGLQMESCTSDDQCEKETHGSGPSTDRLRKELTDKSSALENAKMIITSLENASNTIAADLRAKLRAKDDEYNRLKQESSDRQKTLDILATELRDLQSSNARNTGCSDADGSRRFALSSRLEKNIAEIRAASVVLEATQDPASVHSLGAILEDSVNVLKDGIAFIDEYDEDGSSSDAASQGSANTDNARFLRYSQDLRRLRRELEDAKKHGAQLEDTVRKYKDELKRVRAHAEEARRLRDDDAQSLHAEIRILRQQCNTNMQVLARKERELAVLRDSLQVEDLNVGYISDDNSEGDEEADERAPTASVSLSVSQYGPSQAEALATLLSQGGNHSFDSATSGAVRTQIESLKVELARSHAEKEKLARELKIEKESLSNAKMIISSLERANKSMMEDLRSRLQDSNSAIASLLEKSLESEKTSSRLRAELADALQRERERSFEEECSSHALMVLPIETID